MPTLIPCPHPQVCGVLKGHLPGSADAQQCAIRGQEARKSVAAASQLARPISAAGNSSAQTEQFSPGEGRYLSAYTSAEFADAHVANAYGKKFTTAWDVRIESGTNDFVADHRYYSETDQPPTAEEVVFDITLDYQSIKPYLRDQGDDAWAEWGQAIGLSGDAAHDEFRRIDDTNTHLRGVLDGDYKEAAAEAWSDYLRNFEHPDDVDQNAFNSDEEMFGRQDLQEPFTITSSRTPETGEIDQVMDQASLNGSLPNDEVALATVRWLGVRMDDSDNGFVRAAGGVIDRDDLLETIESTREGGVSESIDERDLRDLDVLERWVREHPSNDAPKASESFQVDYQVVGGQQFETNLDEAIAGGSLDDDTAMTALYMLGVNDDEPGNGFVRATEGRIDRQDLDTQLLHSLSRGDSAYTPRQIDSMRALRRWLQEKP